NIQNVSALITHQVLTPSITLPSSAAWKENYIKPNGFNIGFAVGSGKAQKFKRWDFNNFVDLAKRLQADNINCLLIIGPDEVDLHQKAQVENIQIVEESLLQTALVISKLNMLVGNDNGMMHIGYATNITTLTIFGMTDERIIGGYNDRNHVFSLPMECRPCFRSEVGKIKCDNTVCLSNIDVDSVYKKIKKLCIDKKL
ncbi:MAG: glycosyltransferase family 9 protein, partial [Campylobacterota bacterium]|nr:glycosyltransferase family 9 protein [Campylobacterota bacterium]